MKNKEKYAEEIIEAVTCRDSNGKFAVNENTGEVVNCIGISCKDCAFFIGGKGCNKARAEWSEEEYTEHITAESLKREYSKICCDNVCGGCKYKSSNCEFGWLLDHYNLTKKEDNT